MVMMLHQTRALAGPEWRAHPEVWVFISLVAVTYWWAVRRLAPWFAEEGQPRVERWRAVAFGTGLAFIWAVSDWPLHDLAEEALLSVHMVEHLVLALIVPPLLIVGLPPWMWGALLRPIGGLVRRVVHPAVGLVVFNGVFVLTHWPPVLAAQTTSESIHFLAHTILVLSALIMFWPVYSPLADFPRLSPFMRMGYLFLQTILPTVPASFLTFSQTFLYGAAYSTTDRVWGVDPVVDQQIAGLVMKLGGGVILWVMITTVFFQWAGSEDSGRPKTTLSPATVTKSNSSEAGVPGSQRPSKLNLENGIHND